MTLQVLLNSPEDIQTLTKEIHFMQTLQHPNLLPLLDSSLQNSIDPAVTVAYMLYPLYEVCTKIPEPSHASVREQHFWNLMAHTRQIAVSVGHAVCDSPYYAANTLLHVYRTPDSELLSVKVYAKV